MATPAQSLNGQTLANGWKVIQKVTPLAGSTGGNFSDSYIVELSKGKKGFLKAMDYIAALESDDPASNLKILVDAYTFERDLLRKCDTSKLDFVVTILDDGKITINGNVVQYLIFELANSDMRSLINLSTRFDNSVKLRSLHNIAIGLGQLHSIDIAHQDLKPSNVLQFENNKFKLTDLGRSASKDDEVFHMKMKKPGDGRYMPPEILYGQIDSDWKIRRIGVDLYLFGSMIVSLFTQQSMTAVLFSRIPKIYDNFELTYSDIFPYILNAFEESVQLIKKDLPSEARDELCEIIRQLCHPDPLLRGDPDERAKAAGNPYSLEKYVSKFNRLARLYEIK